MAHPAPRESSVDNVAECITITIHPSPDGNGNLTVADAMQQVLDLIELVGKADDAAADDGIRVVWRLARASASSPFNVVAESTSSDPAVLIDLRAARQTERFRRGVSGLLREGARPDWMDATALRLARRIFDRNINGIGRTDLAFDGAIDDLNITPPTARHASLSLDKAVLDERLATEDYTRTEYGSVEGRIVAATTWYNHPALVLRERLSGDRVTCVLSEALANEIGLDHNLYDIWRGRRVCVGGALHYDAESTLSKIDAETMEAISDDLIDLNEIRSLPFGGGLTPEKFMLQQGAEDVG